MSAESLLFKPISVGALALKNRAVRSATWDGTAGPDGAVTDDSVALFRELARGEIGLIITGHAFISILGQATPRQYGIYSDDLIPGLSRLVEAAHRGGSNIAIQISHSGINSPYLQRQGLPLQVVSPRESPKTSQEELTEENIEAIIDDFAAASRRAVDAGFDAIQLHGAHGYLMSQFLSPLYNHRRDRWGGSIINRNRFHLEVISRIRKTIGDEYPLLIKFGAREHQENGLSLDEGIETAVQMIDAGIDAIEISTGYSRRAIPKPRGNEIENVYFRETAAVVKRRVTVPVILVGGIRSLQIANDILEKGDADLISMCRPFILEPDLLLRWQKGELSPARCISCNKCVSTQGMVACKEKYRL